LIIGKAHYNRGEYDDAVRELEAAVQGNPKLPFVHFNLGLALFATGLRTGADRIQERSGA